jgi:hypothetical protein
VLTPRKLPFCGAAAEALRLGTHQLKLALHPAHGAHLLALVLHVVKAAQGVVGQVAVALEVCVHGLRVLVRQVTAQVSVAVHGQQSARLGVKRRSGQLHSGRIEKVKEGSLSVW